LTFDLFEIKIFFMSEAEKTNLNQEVEIMQEIQKKLPPKFMHLDSLQKFDCIVKIANKVLNPPGDWILVNGEMTLMELISPPSIKNP